MKKREAILILMLPIIFIVCVLLIIHFKDRRVENIKTKLNEAMTNTKKIVLANYDHEGGVERHFEDEKTINSIIEEIMTMHKPDGNMVYSDMPTMKIKLYDEDEKLIVEFPYNNYYIYLDTFGGKNYYMLPMQMDEMEILSTALKEMVKM